MRWKESYNTSAGSIMLRSHEVLGDHARRVWSLPPGAKRYIGDGHLDRYNIKQSMGRNNSTTGYQV